MQRRKKIGSLGFNIYFFLKKRFIHSKGREEALNFLKAKYEIAAAEIKIMNN